MDAVNNHFVVIPAKNTITAKTPKEQLVKSLALALKKIKTNTATTGSSSLLSALIGEDRSKLVFESLDAKTKQPISHLALKALKVRSSPIDIKTSDAANRNRLTSCDEFWDRLRPSRVLKSIAAFNGLQRLEQLLFNELPVPGTKSGKSFEEQNKLHREAGNLIFFYLLAGTYNSKTAWKQSGATMVTGKGSMVDHTEAAHHSAFGEPVANISDEIYQKLSKYFSDLRKFEPKKAIIDPEFLMQLLACGISANKLSKLYERYESREVKFDLRTELNKVLNQHGLNESLNQDSALYYYLHSALVADASVNRADDRFEAFIRPEMVRILNHVSQGNLTPFAGFKEYIVLARKAQTECIKMCDADDARSVRIKGLINAIHDNFNRLSDRRCRDVASIQQTLRKDIKELCETILQLSDFAFDKVDRSLNMYRTRDEIKRMATHVLGWIDSYAFNEPEKYATLDHFLNLHLRRYTLFDNFYEHILSNPYEIISQALKAQATAFEHDYTLAELTIAEPAVVSAGNDEKQPAIKEIMANYWVYARNLLTACHFDVAYYRPTLAGSAEKKALEALSSKQAQLVDMIKALQGLALQDHADLSGIELLSVIKAIAGATAKFDEQFREMVALDRGFEKQLKPAFVTRSLTDSIPKLQRTNRILQKAVDEAVSRMKSMSIPQAVAGMLSDIEKMEIAYQVVVIDFEESRNRVQLIEEKIQANLKMRESLTQKIQFTHAALAIMQAELQMIKEEKIELRQKQLEEKIGKTEAELAGMQEELKEFEYTGAHLRKEKYDQNQVVELIEKGLHTVRDEWEQRVQHLANALSDYDKNPTLANTETRKELQKLILFLKEGKAPLPDALFIRDVKSALERIQKEAVVADLKTELLKILKQLRYNTDFDEPLSQLSSMGRFKEKLDRRNRLLPEYTLKV